MIKVLRECYSTLKNNCGMWWRIVLKVKIESEIQASGNEHCATILFKENETIKALQKGQKRV